MNYRGHLLFGYFLVFIFVIVAEIYIGLNLFYIEDIDFLLMSIVFIFIFSLLPDIDLKKSKISKIFKSLSFIGLLLAFVFYFIGDILSNSELVALLWGSVVLFLFTSYCTSFKHRHFTHTYLFLLVVLVFLVPVFEMTYYSLIIVAVLSFMSHLIGDRMPLGSSKIF